jgi:hypothetical protein
VLTVSCKPTFTNTMFPSPSATSSPSIAVCSGRSLQHIVKALLCLFLVPPPPHKHPVLCFFSCLSA